MIAAVAIGLASTTVFIRGAGGEFAFVGDDSDFGVLNFLLINGGLAACRLCASTARAAHRRARGPDRPARERA